MDSDPAFWQNPEMLREICRKREVREQLDTEALL
jgi:hypothetical protein